jgi:general secretion pathway protein L
MTLLRDIGAILSRWLDGVAATIIAALGRLVSPRVVRIVEEADGSSFTLRGADNASGSRDRLTLSDSGSFGALPPDALKAIKGNRVEIVLRPSRFVFRQLELPRRAVEFLDGVIRAQIDRLTPWSAADAVFGWGRPADVATDRISVLIAATARGAVRPVLDALSDVGAASIAIFTAPADGAATATIKVYDQSIRGTLDAMRMSRILLIVLVIAAGAASLAIAADATMGGSLEQRQLDLTHRINERRAQLRGGQNGVARSASATLDRRKQETPASVIVIEALSEILPDHTYVTELRVEGNRLQVIGVTQDAPGLIRLMEQSQHFKRATFFAPTTRSPTDPGERFHIEARIEPVNMPRS